MYIFNKIVFRKNNLNISIKTYIIVSEQNMILRIHIP